MFGDYSPNYWHCDDTICNLWARLHIQVKEIVPEIQEAITALCLRELQGLLTKELFLSLTLTLYFNLHVSSMMLQI